MAENIRVRRQHLVDILENLGYHVKPRERQLAHMVDGYAHYDIHLIANDTDVRIGEISVVRSTAKVTFNPRAKDQFTTSRRQFIINELHHYVNTYNNR